MKRLLALSAVLALAPLAQAADPAAGKARAEAVCAACHGAHKPLDAASYVFTLKELAASR